LSERTEQSRTALAADIGGTFTDIVLERGAQRWSHKQLTTHDAPEHGLLAGISAVLSSSGTSPGDVDWFVHGTTLATNAILERKGARTAFLTTRGFRDVLEMGYEGRHDPMDLNLQKQVPLVERALRFGVRERIAGDGEVLIDLDEAEVRAICIVLRESSVESVAVGLLHAYASDRHERRIAEILKDCLPGVPVSLSSRVCPEIREYERFSTTCANAYVQPLVSSYLARLECAVRARGLACPLVLMASSGGIIPLSYARALPIRLIESGPAGGAILSASLAAELSENRLLSFDMGGTTAKVCFIDDGVPQISRLFEVDRTARFAKGSGLPLRVPVVELVEIGAGGGSIASVDDLGRIVVGPQSAGSEPGPASYDRGGSAPTVTDADLVLGKLDATNFAGGSIVLNAEKAACALEEGVGRRLDLQAGQAAHGVCEIVDETMANLARSHGLELGKDIGARTMIAFGGAAPLHAARIAEKLGIGKVVVPRGAGVGSAVGFLRAPVAYDIVVGRPMPLSALDHAVLHDLFAEIETTASSVLMELGNLEGVARSYSADLRYAGQGHELEIGFAALPVDAGALRVDFETEYRRLFGNVPGDASIQAISWRLRLSKEVAPDSGDCPSSIVLPRQPAPPQETRRAFDVGLGSYASFRVVNRDDLMPHRCAQGPALIVEPQTTTVVPSSFSYRLGEGGHLFLSRTAGPEATA
jgi:N-methylhydantoinase A